MPPKFFSKLMLDHGGFSLFRACFCWEKHIFRQTQLVRSDPFCGMFGPARPRGVVWMVVVKKSGAYPLVNIEKRKTLWKDSPFLMGKSTISMVIFNSKLLVYQRVTIFFCGCVFLAGWWFGTMEFYDFPETVGIVIIPTDFHCHIFRRGRWLNHQPVYMIIYTYIQIYCIILIHVYIYIYCIILYNNIMFTIILY